jgi:hypothetical protein
MLAKVETWVGFLIFAIWAVSAFLEYQRKKKAAEQAAEKAAQRQPASQTVPESKSNQHDDSLEGFEDRELREAEEAVRSQPYRPNRRGEDLSVNLDELLREILLPETSETSQPQSDTEMAPALQSEPALVDAEFQPVRFNQLKEMERSVSADFRDEIRDEGSQRTETVRWSGKNLFSQGYVQAILASEILSKPRSQRPFRSR